MSEEVINTASPAPAPAQASRKEDRPSTFDSVSDAVAELDRRDREHRAARRAEKAAKAAKDAPTQEGDADDYAEAKPRGDDLADEPAPKKPKAEAKSAKTEDTEDTDAEAADDTPANDGNEEDPEDGSQEATDDSDEASEDTATVELDGKKLEIPKGTPKALVDGVKRMASELKADYTRKTQEAAQQAAQGQHQAQAAQQTMQRVQAAQQAVLQMAQQMIGEPPPLALAQQDIQSYTIQKALYEQRMGQLQQLMGHGQALTQQQQAQAQAQRSQVMQAEAQRMVQVLPELAKPEARRAFLDAASQAAAASGFTAEDVAGVGDHRMLHLLHRLVTLEKREAARTGAAQSVKTKLANVPPKVNRPGAATQDQGRGERHARAKERFMRSSKTMKDAAAYARATAE
jgi:hypothetical protein